MSLTTTWIGLSLHNLCTIVVSNRLSFTRCLAEVGLKFASCRTHVVCHHLRQLIMITNLLRQRCGCRTSFSKDWRVLTHRFMVLDLLKSRGQTASKSWRKPCSTDAKSFDMNGLSTDCPVNAHWFCWAFSSRKKLILKAMQAEVEAKGYQLFLLVVWTS